MPNPSVTVTGAGSEWDNAQPLPIPSIDEMKYATQVAPAYNPAATPAPSSSVLDSLPSMDEISNYLTNLPVQAQRLLTNPAAFTEMLTGKNPLPEQTGFAASATGLPAQNPNSLFTPEGMAYNTGYESGEPIGIAAGAIPALGEAAPVLARAAGERILSGKSLIPGVPSELVNPQIMSAVKEKGGNWAQNSLNRLDELKEAPGANLITDFTDMTPDQANLVKTHSAINNWIDSKLKKYVRNDMGTPTDPVRELADQGITHIKNLGEQPPSPSYSEKDFIGNKRAIGNMPREGFANTPAGQDWERRSDVAIDQLKAGNINPGSSAIYSADIGSLAEKNPEALVHALDSQTYRLGFDHLVDELATTIHPNSDLPAHLRMKPEALERVTVPQAVKHVHKINKWRIEQMAKAAKEDLNHFPVVHEGGNGYNIHELKLPEVPLELPKGYKTIPVRYEGDDTLYHAIADETGKEIEHSPMAKSPKNVIYKYNANLVRQKLDRALKNEGEQMGHCVGGYTDSVARGDSRIFSLRDPKGGAHATIEAQPRLIRWENIPREVKDEANRLGDTAAKEHGYDPNHMAYGNYHQPVYEKYLEDWISDNPVLDIPQIRGKGNGKIADKYQGYIKDWLNKEADKIVHIEPDELHNAGLIDLKNGVVKQVNLHPTLREKFANGEIPRFLSDEDVKKALATPPKPKVPEHKMLQGFYRGYAGEGAHPEGTTFVSPQKAVADYYAQKRAGQTGLAPHAEMVLADPFAGVKYGHATAGTGAQPNIVTQARKLTPEQIANRTQLYAEGGKVEAAKLTPAQMRDELFAKSREYQAQVKANEPRTLQQRMIDQGVLKPTGGGSGGGFTPGTMNPFNPDSPLNRKNGGKIPSTDEMRLTIIRNK